LRDNMVDDHYKLIFTGAVAPNTSTALVGDDLAARFNLTRVMIDRLFSGGDVVLKNGVDYATASKLKRAFENAGAICRIESNRAPKNITDLPATPQVAKQVMAKVADPETRVEDLQKVLAADQQLTAKILRIANSSFYGGHRSVSNLSDAIVRLGFKTIKNLVIASAVKSLSGKSGFVQDLLWQHSIGCAIAAQTIARKVNYRQLEEAFLVGLMHDIGKVVFHLQAPDVMLAVTQQLYNEPHWDRDEIERERFGVGHAEVGRQVAEKWHFPETIEEAIAWHHQPRHASREPVLAQITQLADAICHKLEIGPIRKPDLDLAGLASAGDLQLGAQDLDELAARIGTTYETEKSAFLL